MLAEKSIEPTVVTDASHHRLTFFRQSGWMIIATVVSGVFASAVHILSKRLPSSEYSAAAWMIQVIGQMQIPALGLQLVFAHQASAAITEQQRRQLAGTFRSVMRWTFCIWLAMAAFVALQHKHYEASLNLTNPWSLWLTVLSGLMMIWTPMFNGLLQGRQNFLWMGWVSIISNVGRVAIAVLIVIYFHGLAAGVMLGVFLGLAAGVAVAIWQNWDLLTSPGEAFDARAWLRHVTPLTLASGVGFFLQSEDGVIVPYYMGADLSAPYMFGGTLARAIPLLTGPLAAVMFPKLVHRKARSLKGGPNILGLTVLGTFVLGCVGAIGLTLFSRLIIRLGSKPEFATSYIVSLMPLFAWAMVPLAMGNVLLNNLNAHSYFKPVPWLVALAVGYGLVLTNFHSSFKMVIETLAVFNLLYLAIVGLFTWQHHQHERALSAH